MTNRTHIVASFVLGAMAVACVTTGSFAERVAPACGEGSEEQRSRCFVDALGTCRPASIRTSADEDRPGGYDRWELIRDEKGRCVAVSEYYDAEGRLVSREHCSGVTIILSRGFVLGRSMQCAPAPTEP